MSRLTNLTATRHIAAFGDTGDFWASGFGDKFRSRRLVALTSHNHVWQRVEEGMRNLAGDSDYEIVRDEVITFDPSEVLMTGDIFYDDAGITYDGGLNYDSSQTRYWVLPVQNGIVPFCIQTFLRKLLVGIDFFVIDDKKLVFKVDPRVYGDGTTYVVACGRRRRRNLLDHATGVTSNHKVSRVVNYCRNSQTPKAFELALAEIGGLEILDAPQQLVDINVTTQEVIYTFTSEVHRVAYSHDLSVMQKGKFYPADYVIGEAIRVYHKTDQTAWWRPIPFGAGLSLDPIMDQKGLFLVNDYVTAVAASADSNGKLHVRFPMSIDSTVDDAYWESVRLREIESGDYINDTLGLTSVGERKILHPFEVMFGALRSKVIVVTVQQDAVRNQVELFHFIRREAPAGCVMLVIGRIANLPSTTLNLGTIPDTLQIVLNADDTYALSGQKNTYDMNGAGKRVDFIRIKHETLVK